MIYQLTQTGDQVQTILDQAPTTEQSLQEEITRSTGKDEQLETAIGNEKTRAEGVEANLQTAIGNEKTRAEGAEGNLNTAIGNEKTRAELVEGGLRTDVDGINAKIPTGASSENKLATQSFVNSSVATATADFKGTYDSLEALETAVHDANANDYAFVISTDAAGNTVYNRYKYVEGTGWVFEYALNNSSFTSAQWAAINSAITAALVAKLTGLPTATELTTQLNAIIDSVATEKSRAEGIESGLRTDVNANATAIGTEKTRAEGAEGNLSTAIGNEKTRAEGAELVLQQNINAEALLRGNADTALQTSIDGINAKIPAAASASNQLADKTFVNSSIATNTATFRGTYNSVEALDEVTADNNDYAFVVATDTAGNTVYNRYKYVEGSGWVFEYALNNSSFTATQWAAVNSGITAALVTKLTGLPDNTALTAMFTAITSLIPAAATSDNKLVDYAQLVAGLATKQNTLTFDNAPTENSSNPVKSGGVYTAIATVTAAIVGLQSSKQDVLTFDQYPTAGSNNPVKSTGIYTAIENAVAPKANQTALDAETTRATNAESGLSTRISTNAADIAALQAAYAGLTQNDVVVVATTDTWPVSNPQQNVIYRVVDRVNTPPQYYSDYMWNGTAMVLMATYNNAIDDEPTPYSNNLTKSGGIAKYTKGMNVFSLLTDFGYRCGNYLDGGITETSEGKWACLLNIDGNVRFKLDNVAVRNDNIIWISCYSDYPTPETATSVYLGYVGQSGDFYVTPASTKYMLINVSQLGGNVKIYNSFDVDKLNRIYNNEKKFNYYGLTKSFGYRCGNYEDGGLADITADRDACLVPIGGNVLFLLDNVPLRGDNKVWISCYSDYPTPDNATVVYLGYANTSGVFYVTPANTKYMLINVTSIAGAVKIYTDYDKTPEIWLPEKIYALVGVELQLFTCGMVAAEFPDNYSLDIQKIEGDEGYNLSRMFEWTPSALSSNMKYKFGYKEDAHLPFTIQASNTDLIVVQKKTSPASNKNILCIGDSFTDADFYPAELKRLLTGVQTSNLSDPREVNGNDGLTNLTFIGTQDADKVPNEGYAGKSYHWFATSDENPFWDSNENDINFTSYCTRNGFSQIDYAIILLGTNTGNDEADIKKVWNKLLEHNPNIKVIVMGRCFANHYGGTGSIGMANNLTWYLESRNVIPLNKRLQEYCKENAYASNFLYVDYNVAFDSLHNMGTIVAPANNRNPDATVIQGNDNVHPSKYGYYQIADTVRAAVHYWFL